VPSNRTVAEIDTAAPAAAKNEGGEK